jgi:hypothetical protein
MIAHPMAAHPMAAHLIAALLLAPQAESPATAAAAPPAPPAAAGSSAVAGVPVARFAYLSESVQSADASGRWHDASEGGRFATGDRVRTGPTGLVRVAFPWMSLTAGPSSTVSIPPERILSAVLDEGRVETASEGEDIVKLRTAEAEVRGQGRGIVRRARGTTWVMAQEGTFRVESKKKTVVLKAGQGARVRAGRAPEAAVPLPAAPRDLWPAGDPVYVTSGQPVALRWTSEAPLHRLEVLGLDSDEVLLARELPEKTVSIVIPWLGTYRWRVYTLDREGLESRPSAEGLVCVVER